MRRIDRSHRERHTRIEDVILKIMKIKPHTVRPRDSRSCLKRFRKYFPSPSIRSTRPLIPNFGVSHRSSQQFSCTHQIETSRSQTYAGRTLSRRRSPSHPPHPSSLDFRSIHIRLDFVSRIGRTSRFDGTCSRLAFHFAFASNELTKIKGNG